MSPQTRPRRPRRCARLTRLLQPPSWRNTTLFALAGLVFSCFLFTGLVLLLRAPPPASPRPSLLDRLALRRLLWRNLAATTDTSENVSADGEGYVRGRCAVIECGPTQLVLSVEERTVTPCNSGQLDDDGCCDREANDTSGGGNVVSADEIPARDAVQDTSSRACAQCGPTRCCSSFAGCIACCLQPSQETRWEAVNELVHARIAELGGELPRGSPPKFEAPLTMTLLSHGRRRWIDHCVTRCRVSSAATLHESDYRGGQRFCFGVLRPPLDVMTIQNLT